MRHFHDARNAANWTMGEILRIVNDRKCAVGSLKTTPTRFAALLDLLAKGTISAQSGKKVIDIMEVEDRDPAAIVADHGLAQVSDAGLLEEAVRKAIEANPDEAQRFREGEKKLMGFFVGQAKNLTGGKGNPKEISSLVMKMLGAGG